ncbi:MAG: nucleoside monophosphate kinase [Thermoproteota archaeon]|nr:nucleoside monophosphate kinase [Candidatus Brockarchaeota archaeon]MBO3763246.1 nucleoside monophosphate kinase [Candidatus Brockarchaeota archaeon]MBO3768021.1 nucleoside monophosphate kinase [Candidatus Brockarchaeota archaeon]MBO3800762.1 nucleoside monophosphate kinase [Candidatus Brockarchaeota archaeon]
MMDKTLIVVTGLPGAGKSTVSNLIMEEYNLPVISMGDCVREEARKRGIKEDAKSMQEFIVELRRKYGPGIVAELTTKKIEKLNQKFIVVDGLRSKEELEIFKRNFKRILLLVIVASIEKRLKRLLMRHRVDDPKTLEELKARDEVELNIGLREVTNDNNSIRIENEGDLQELKQNVREIMEKLEIQKMQTEV